MAVSTAETHQPAYPAPGARHPTARQTSWGDRVSALPDPDDAPDLDGTVPRGRGLWETTAQPAQIVHCWYASQSSFPAQLDARTVAIRRSGMRALGSTAAFGWVPVDLRQQRTTY